MAANRSTAPTINVAGAGNPAGAATLAPDAVLSFGIPSLDELLGCPTPHEGVLGQRPDDYGIHVPQGHSTSLCLIGPDGTGKSVLGLHLAAQYASTGTETTRVLYASTDLSHARAMATWTNFALGLPQKRHAAVEKTLLAGRAKSRRPGDPSLELELVRYPPLITHEEARLSSPPSRNGHHRLLTGYLVEHPRQVSPTRRIPVHEIAFIDLESSTAGDDWGLINRLLATLERHDAHEPLDLLIVDAVEGLETLGGKQDAFGHERDRRSRIAQIIRAAKDKCHVVFVVEEPREHERLPEEFVCDAVLRLRVERQGDYSRRTLEIEKLRGQAYVRGRHDCLIRRGTGSETGDQPNADDRVMRIEGDDEPKAYFQVIPSLHYLSREVMEEPLAKRRELAQTDEGRERLKSLTVDPRASSVQSQPPGLCGFGIEFLDEMIGDQGLATRNRRLREKGLPTKSVPAFSDLQGLPWGSITTVIGDEGTHKGRVGRAFLAQAFRGANDIFSPERGIALLLTTHHLSRDNLAARFLKHQRAVSLDPLVRAVIEQEVDILRAAGEPADDEVRQRLEDKYKVDAMKKRIICRRLEIHHMTSAVLFQIIHALVQAGREELGVKVGGSVEEYKEGLPSPGQIRLVIDDWSDIRDAFPDIRDDPLFLPFLLFYLKRQGITTLILNTQPGKLGHVLTQESARELRVMVPHHIYTWHVTFFGEKRVAVAALPPISDDKSVVVRELSPHLGDEEELKVDPHFEYYSGFEDDAPPKAVPLQVRLYADGAAQTEYLSEVDELFRRLFGGFENKMQIILPESDSYEMLRDSTYLQGGTALEYTLVLQVDEFWSQDGDALLDLSEYMDAATTGSSNGYDPVEDPFRLYQPIIIGDLYKRISAAVEEFGRPEEIAPATVAIEKAQPSPEPTGNQAPAPAPELDAAVTLEPKPESEPKLQPTLELKAQPATEQAQPTLEQKEASDTESTQMIDATESHDEDASDAAQSFAPTVHLRHQSFETRGYRLRQDSSASRDKESTLDRVPYVVDFGFLLADHKAWKKSIRDQPPESRELIREVWERLTLPTPPLVSLGDLSPPIRVSWRRFFEACRIVARGASSRETGAERRGFDIDLATFESLSCLFLEIWGSEVRELQAWAFWSAHFAAEMARYHGPHPEGPQRALQNIEGRSFPRWRDDAQGFGLPELCVLYRRPLFRTWLLIASAWAPDASDRDGFRLRKRPASTRAVASRHWYSTACPAAVKTDHLMPIRLPGSCIVRGDWFCGIARGSRSRRLGERAIDLLCSRRANLTRMQLGLGLPTRGFRDATQHWAPEFRSPLSTYDIAGRPRNLNLRDFEWLGAQPPDEDAEPAAGAESAWLWRSRIMHYDRHSRIWTKWLLYTYDNLMDPSSPAFRLFTSADECLRLYDSLEEWAKSPRVAWPADTASKELLRAFTSFESLCRDLERALARATIRPIDPVDGDDFH